MATHGNQVMLSHTNLLLSSTGLEPGMGTFHGFTAGQQGWQLPSVVCSTAWWVFSAFSFSSSGGLQACLFYMVPFWKSKLFFFSFLRITVSWAVPLQPSIAEWLRWERPYEDHLILPSSVFSFKPQCRCSKSAEKWACKTVMIPAYLTTHPVFPVGNVRYSVLVFLDPILC